MSTRPLTEAEALAAVDDALRTYPLAPAPAAFTPKVMSRIRALTPAPRFSLAWIDYAISLFAAGMAGLLIFLWQSIPPQMAMRAQLQILYLFMRFNLALLWPALLVGGLMAVVVLLMAVVLFGRGRPALVR
jgi:hypothetical protein